MSSKEVLPPPSAPPAPPAFGPGSKWNTVYHANGGDDEIDSASSYDDDSLAPPSSRDTTPSPSPSSVSQPLTAGEEFVQKPHYVSSLNSDNDPSPTPSSSSSSARTPVVVELVTDTGDADHEVIEINSNKYGLDKVVEEPEYEGSEIDANIRKTTAQVEIEEFEALDNNCVAMSQRYELGNDDDEEPNTSRARAGDGEQNVITIVDPAGKKRVVSLIEYEQMEEEERDQYIVVVGEDSDDDGGNGDGVQLVAFPTEMENLTETITKTNVEVDENIGEKIEPHNTIETLCKSLLTTVANVVLPHTGHHAENQPSLGSITSVSSDSGKPLTPPAVQADVSELHKEASANKKGPLVRNATQQLMDSRRLARATQDQQQSYANEDEDDDEVKSENSGSVASCTSPATMLTQQQSFAGSERTTQVAAQKNSIHSLASTPTPTPDVPSSPQQTPSSQDLYSSAALVALPPPPLPTATSMLAAKAGLVKQLVIQQQKQHTGDNLLPQQLKSPDAVNGTVLSRKQAYQRQETPIEQEIRLAKEREEQHRAEHGLAPLPASGTIIQPQPQQQQQRTTSPKAPSVFNSAGGATQQAAIAAPHVKNVLSHRSSLESPLANNGFASVGNNKPHHHHTQGRPFSIAEVYNSAAAARNSGSAHHHHHQYAASTIPPNSPDVHSAGAGEHLDKHRQWATNRIRREIEEQQVRENELKQQHTPNSADGTAQNAFDGESPQQYGNNANKFQFGNGASVTTAPQREKPENIAPPVGVREAARSFESIKTETAVGKNKKPFTGAALHKTGIPVSERRTTFNGGALSPSTRTPTSPSSKSPFSPGGHGTTNALTRQCSGSAALAAAINRGVYQQQQHNGSGNGAAVNGVAGDGLKSVVGSTENTNVTKAPAKSQKSSAQSLIERELEELQQREDELRRERGLPPIYTSNNGVTNENQSIMTNDKAITDAAAPASPLGGTSHSARNGTKAAVHSSSVAPSRELFRQWEQMGQ